MPFTATPFTPLIDDADVRQQLIGLQPVLAAVDDGELTALIEDSIQARQNEFEQDCHLLLYPRVIKAGGTEGVDCDVSEDPYDFHTSSYPMANYLRLRRRPVQSVESLRLEYGPTLQLITYPPEWIRLNRQQGRVTILPLMTGTGAITIGEIAGSYWLPMLQGGWFNGVVPQVLSVDYTAGYANGKTHPDLARVRQQLARIVSVDVRGGLAEIIPTSASRDGASASYALGPATQMRMLAGWDTFKQDFSQQQFGVNMVVL